jgi:hypothetical protein
VLSSADELSSYQVHLSSLDRSDCEGMHPGWLLDHIRLLITWKEAVVDLQGGACSHPAACSGGAAAAGASHAAAAVYAEHRRPRAAPGCSCGRSAGGA